MGVRFESGARRAIDAAMIEVERREHGVLDTGHLLLGLLSVPNGALANAAGLLGLEVDALRDTAEVALLAEASAGDGGSVDVAPGAEMILQTASDLSRARGAAAVSDGDIVAAALQFPESVAGAVLLAAGVTSAAASMPAEGDRTATRAVPATLPAAPRSGIGYDSHRFAPGVPLVLGGVSIASDVGLVGHSDGDAVAHAITDAVLGAAGAGDVGEMFSDTDPTNRGRDSLEMLRAAVGRVAERGLAVHHVDVTVIAEHPRISAHRDAMRAALARALAVAPDAVSVKGKTNEGMGWIGRREGLACVAIATLVPAPPSA